MPRYALDDPRLQQEIEAIAAETAANWPVTDEMLAKLSPLLNPPPKTRPVMHPVMPDRRAA